MTNITSGVLSEIMVGSRSEAWSGMGAPSGCRRPSWCAAPCRVGAAGSPAPAWCCPSAGTGPGAETWSPSAWQIAGRAWSGAQAAAPGRAVLSGRSGSDPRSR